MELKDETKAKIGAGNKLYLKSDLNGKDGYSYDRLWIKCVNGGDSVSGDFFKVEQKANPCWDSLSKNSRLSPTDHIGLNTLDFSLDTTFYSPLVDFTPAFSMKAIAKTSGECTETCLIFGSDCASDPSNKII